MAKSQCVEVEIIGGLGNQLFGYAAGLFLSKKTSSELRLNLGMVGVGGTNHGKSLLGFSIPAELFVDAPVFQNRSVLTKRIINKAARHSNLIRDLRNRLNHEYTSTELGFEESFWNLESPRKIKGYFQSHLYADVVEDELRKRLVIENPTDWYLEQIKVIEKVNPVAIHLRRGDYLNLTEEFGILDVSYYASIIKEYESEIQSRPLWIFTDSPELVKVEIRGTILENSLVLIPPGNSSANESLLLMSMCQTLVISNSTFSWWAAYLSKSSSTIHAPSKWFRGRKDPNKLIPANWKLCESIWKR